MGQGKFMLRAIELARRGLGYVSPNPLVGCVIIKDGNIIGEGWHMEFGKEHAEVNALKQVKNQDSLKESELYVTLEPCAHFGKTPPCADLIIEKGIKKVFVAVSDPNPIVNGKGIKKLESAGIKVELGIEEASARLMNRRYITAMTHNRPYLILKWAQTLDGFIAKENHQSKWISNDLSRQLAHQWRAEEDGVLVGFNTVKYDNPQLNVRDWTGKNPIRIIIDEKLQLSSEYKIFDKSQPSFIYNILTDKKEDNLHLVKIKQEGFINEMLVNLVNNGIHSVMIEGGKSTLQDFIDQNLWDEARVIISDKIFNIGISSPVLKNQVLMEKITVREDNLYLYRNQN